MVQSDYLSYHVIRHHTVVHQFSIIIIGQIGGTFPQAKLVVNLQQMEHVVFNGIMS